jgi:hypothetical protein
VNPRGEIEVAAEVLQENERRRIGPRVAEPAEDE